MPETCRVYGVPPGADFAASLVAGLDARSGSDAPEARARTTLLLNSARMRRLVRAAYDRGPARLLPRLRLLQDIGLDTVLPGIPPAIRPLRRKLELSRLISALIAADPTAAPSAAVYDLADTLTALLDELHEEGVAPQAIRSLDVTDASGHWARSQRFVALVQDYLTAGPDRAPDPGQRQRLAVQALLAAWAEAPPAHPVVLAGSTGSRGTTLDLMQGVAGLDTGAVVLPGFDAGMPAAIWSGILADRAEDHPQYRHAILLDRLGIAPDAVRPWAEIAAPAPARNRLVSLSLRPAPVTDQWMRDGATLGPLPDVTADMTLIEAPTARAEAASIALILRAAAEEGRSASLVTPDRTLARRVTALLDRWGIEPDDSAGRPLGQTAPGRLLRQVSAMFARPPGPDALIALLKHPLVNAGARGPHLLTTRRLELWCRRAGVPNPGADRLLTMDRDDTDRREAARIDPAWRAWVAGLLADLPGPDAQPLESLWARHLDIVTRAVAGPSGVPDPLWSEAAGRAAQLLADALSADTPAGGTATPGDYDALIRRLTEQANVRNPDPTHPEIAILGTLEARGLSADLVILGGLNDGTWPALPAADPWLNRAMRRAAGLRSPERVVGLSAHDYQQAAAAREVILTRAVREADGTPVPSRWLNRLMNLLGGLHAQDGPAALAAMRARGLVWLDRAARLDAAPPVAPAPRPSPRPPVSVRPTTLSVSAIEKLIRDPYAVYASRILSLRALDPLRPTADAMLRGTVLHAVMARFLHDMTDGPPADPRAHLLDLTDRFLEDRVPWAAARHLWRARMHRVADAVIADTLRRGSTLLATEVEGTRTLSNGFTLKARADRIDEMPDGTLSILDYKTGKPPTAKEMGVFEVQLLLEAVIAEAGGFDGIDARTVSQIGHIGLGSTPEFNDYPAGEWTNNKVTHDFRPATALARLTALVDRYGQRRQGYTSRRALQQRRFGGDFDHLARFGEWDDTDLPQPEDIG